MNTSVSLISSYPFICFSRAPLGFKAGIPMYCKSIYQSSPIKPLILNCSLSSGLPTETRDTDGFTEITCRSEFVVGTIALSAAYIKFMFHFLKSARLIHIQSPDPLTFLILFVYCIFFGKTFKILTTWHAEIYKSYPLLSPFLCFLDLCIYALSDLIIFFTESHRNTSIFSHFRWFYSKSIISPFIIFPQFRPSKSPLDRYQDYSLMSMPFRIVSIGRLVSYKGYSYAIQAINLCKSLPIHYTIIGNGPLLSKLRYLIKSLNLSGRVSILTDISESDKFEILDKSSVFLFPSTTRSEAYGIAQLEASFCSLPVINTDLGNGVNELLPSSDSITVDPRSPQAIANAIKGLYFSRDNYLYFSMQSLRRFGSLSVPTSNFNLFTLDFFQ